MNLLVTDDIFDIVDGLRGLQAFGLCFCYWKFVKKISSLPEA